MKSRSVFLLYIALLTCGITFCQEEKPSINLKVDFEEFVSRHDMVWDRIPDCWQVAPFTGNGNVGFLLYQIEDGAKNTISLHIGRHDYYDHRLPHEGEQMLWTHRTRLPLGHFNLESKGDIKDVDLRLSLWNAELTGTVTTSLGSYNVHALTHTNSDVIYFRTDAKKGESIKITWHPDEPYSPVRRSLDKGGGPKAPNWTRMANAPYLLAPKFTLSKEDGIQYCYQPLYNNRGETTTAWELQGNPSETQVLTTSIHHSFPESNSKEIVKNNLLESRNMLTENNFFSTHRTWWNSYYPQSFLSISDAEKEAFYWIQMYKFASATRGNGPILDLMGPWYNHTFWPMVWGDLNVQLIYWTHLTANRLEAGESLVNNVDKYRDNLVKNAPYKWEDSATLGALFPQDMDSKNSFPDMLVWLMHDYWLHCEYAGDRERIRNGLFPVLRQAVNSYLNYFKDNPVKSEDGKIHIKNSWSPEYKPGHGQDINFTIGLIKWSCQKLLDIDKEFNLNDPLAKDWKNILNNLVEFQIDKNGLRIGKDIPFDKPHRHYSHLLSFYPLAVHEADNKADFKLVKTSLDHWLDVTVNSGIKIKAMPVTGYTCTGAASMYAWLKDAENAYKYLDMFIKHYGVSPTTMYAEVGYNPVIESPFSYATAMHEMLLQSWNGKIRVFPSTPKKWNDIVFSDLRTQGAFLVSAKKTAGQTQFVYIKSLEGNPCFIETDIKNPNIYINGKQDDSKVSLNEKGIYKIELKKGETVIFTPLTLDKTDLSIDVVNIGEDNHNLFGLSKKTEHLPGHKFYYIERTDKKWQNKF